MRIAVLSDTMLPTPWDTGHGLGRAVYNVASGLCERGHDVTLHGLCGSALPGGRLRTTGHGGFQGEPQLARMVLDCLDEYDVALDAGHMHVMANHAALPTLAYFQDRSSRRAPCAVFVSRDQREYVGLKGPVVRNSVRLCDFPLYEGERDDYVMYMGSATWEHKGLKDAREIAQIAGVPLRAYGDGCGDGLITTADKVPAIQRARAMLCPYYFDAGPHVPLEAMACGTPVVGYALAGMPEYVPDGGGMLGDTKEELAGLLGIVQEYAHEFAPADVRKAMVGAGFASERQVDEIEQLLIQLVKGERW